MTPPIRKSRSPLIFVGAGCGLLIVIVVGMFVFLAAKMAADINRPVNKQQTLISLSGLPIYPGAQFDEQTTRFGRAAMKSMEMFIQAKSSTIAGFHTDDSEDKIIDFYDKKMTALGFTKTTLHTASSSEQAGYVKGRTLVEVQVHPAPKSDSGEMIMLMRFDGAGKEFLGKLPQVKEQPSGVRVIKVEQHKVP